MKQVHFKYVLYSLLFLFLLIPINTISLSMKTLHLSSEPTRTGINANIKVAASTDNTWTNVTNPSGDKPSARYQHSMVYDSINDRVILFGGNDGSQVDDTWIYNYTDNTWTNVTTITGDKPSPREYFSMAYDSNHDRVVLFGGSYGGSYYDDTWVYNYTDNTWTNVTTAGTKPSARRRHSMAYDSIHDRIILFGGSTGPGVYLDDTWVYNYTDNTWTNVTTITGDKPSPRGWFSMVYDSAHDRTILFGGYSTTYCDDTWVYNYPDNTWTNMTTITGDKPFPRSSYSLIYDSTNDRTILFGGYDSSNYRDDTWVYNYADNSWTNITTAGDKPEKRDQHDMVYDSAHNRIILFGGECDFGESDETWVYCFAVTPSRSLLPAGDDDDDDDEDTGAVVVIVVVIIIACVGGVVVVIIVLIKKGIIDISKLKRG